MTRTCLGFAITTFLTCGAITAATEAALPVASTTTTSSFESFFAKASRRGRRMSTRPSRLSLPSSQATASAKARWISRPMIRMVAPPSLFVQGGSWRATRHLLIRAHGASGKVARGGHVTSSGSQPTVYRRPARTFVLPAPRVQDGLTISPSPSSEQADSKPPTDHIPDKGKVERPFRYIREDFFLGGTFRNLDDLNDQLRHWLDTIANPRVHATDRRIVNGAFAEEKPALKPLPLLPYQAVLRLERRASHEGMVSVGGNLYSVPDTTRRRVFDVHVLADAIRIFEDGALVATHAPLEGRGEKRLDPAHRKLARFCRRRPTDPEPVILTRAGDRVVRRSLDFYEAVGRRLAARGGAR